MQLAAWRSRIGDIATEMASARVREEGLQNRLEFALARLWRALQDPPPEVRDAYGRLHEGPLLEASRQRAAGYALEEPPPWTPDADADVRALVLQVAVEIRALDQALFECRDPNHSLDAMREYAAFGDEPVFIVPKVHVTQGRRGQLFDRRGLRHHRILPREVGGFELRLHRPGLRGPGMDGSRTSLLSAMFPKAALDVEPVGEDFRVAGLSDMARASADLAAQLAEFRRHGPALAVAWPELTMPPDLIAELARWLGEQWLEETPLRLGFAVAGSWHVDRDGALVNCATVLDADGVTVLEVLKHEAFELKAGMLEAIRPGTQLPVLVYGDLLIAFAICKDFCDRRGATPYEALDVDLIIVPSLGNAKTMAEHAEAARTLASGYGARCFVVQQLLEPDQAAPWGLVLTPPEQPRSAVLPPRTQDKLLDRTSISCTMP